MGRGACLCLGSGPTVSNPAGPPHRPYAETARSRTHVAPRRGCASFQAKARNSSTSMPCHLDRADGLVLFGQSISSVIGIFASGRLVPRSSTKSAIALSTALTIAGLRVCAWQRRSDRPGRPSPASCCLASASGRSEIATNSTGQTFSGAQGSPLRPVLQRDLQRGNGRRIAARTVVNPRRCWSRLAPAGRRRGREIAGVLVLPSIRVHSMSNVTCRGPRRHRAAPTRRVVRTTDRSDRVHRAGHVARQGRGP